MAYSRSRSDVRVLGEGRLFLLVVALIGGACLVPVHAQSRAWAVARGAEVRVTCPLTVGGSFEAKSAALTGSYRFAEDATGEGDGALVVDLRTLQTGIALRDTHLRETYLEVNKGEDFAHARLSRIRLTWQERKGVTGKGTFTGMLRVHGVERQVSGRMELRQSGTNVRVRATFPVRLPDFEIATPRYLGVGVRDQVDVQVSFETAEEERP